MIKIEKLDSLDREVLKGILYDNPLSHVLYDYKVLKHGKLVGWITFQSCWEPRRYFHRFPLKITKEGIIITTESTPIRHSKDVK